MSRMQGRSGKGVEDVTLLHSGNSGAVGSIGSVTRLLKREQNSLYNCLCSITHDRAFVEEIRALYPALPLLANLRCGLWYTPRPDGTCYFKSTDGHTGQWDFSTVRLNLHVAHMASTRGGLLIVDATRKGKTFSDALSKTVPIWCAVLNRAVARLRHGRRQGMQQGMQQGSSDACQASTTLSSPSQASDNDNDQHVQCPHSSQGLNLTTDSSTRGTTCSCQPDGQAPSTSPAPAWDCSLHLPLWVPRNEALHIEARLEGWVDSLFAVGADIRALEQVLTKPLRPLWIRQSSLIWLNQVCQPEDQSFTPLILISASQPQTYGRKYAPATADPGAGAGDANDVPSPSSNGYCKRGPRPPLHEGRVRWQAADRGAGAKLTSGTQRDSDDVANGLSTDSSSSSGSESEHGRHGRQTGAARGGSMQAAHEQAAPGQQVQRRQRYQQQQQQQGTWTYVYVPGAGDDEESWALGLTPAVFWRHWKELLGAGPMGVHDAVKALLQQEHEQMQQVQVAAPDTPPATDIAADAVTAAVAALRPVETDALHVKPLGCIAAADATSIKVVGPGIHLLGGSGSGIGSFHAGAAPEVWGHVQAVLNCGTLQHPSMASEGCCAAGAGGAAGIAAAPRTASIAQAGAEVGARLGAQTKPNGGMDASSQEVRHWASGQQAGSVQDEVIGTRLHTGDQGSNATEANPILGQTANGCAGDVCCSRSSKGDDARDMSDGGVVGVGSFWDMDGRDATGNTECVGSCGTGPACALSYPPCTSSGGCRTSQQPGTMQCNSSSCCRQQDGSEQANAVTYEGNGDAAAAQLWRDAGVKAMQLHGDTAITSMADGRLLMQTSDASEQRPADCTWPQRSAMHQDHHPCDAGRSPAQLQSCSPSIDCSIDLACSAESGLEAKCGGAPLAASGPAAIPAPVSSPLSDEDSFTFCSSPRGLPCEPYISVPLECPRDELAALRRLQSDALAAQDQHVEAAMNRQSASRVSEAVRQAQQCCQQQQQLQQQLAQQQQQRQHGEEECSVQPIKTCFAALGTAGGALPSAPPPRYLWLPVETSKAARTSLLDALPRALEFLSHHLSLGHRVLIHDALGLDQSVCIAVALLLACFDCSKSPVGSSSAEGSAESTGTGSYHNAVFAGRLRMEGGRLVLPQAKLVTKQSVRQALAFVSSHYPQARPTRGMLKQVFNCFEQHRQAADGQASSTTPRKRLYTLYHV